jgi:VIT1/CCC1 family predicted Fe2+/Mn2+ transporter
MVLIGVASLVAGAFSMGTGEYISVTNQNELVGADPGTAVAVAVTFAVGSLIGSQVR